MINFNGSLGHVPHKHWSKEYQYTFNRDIVFDLLQHQRDFDVELIAAEGKHLFLAHQDKPVELGFFPVQLKANELLSQQSLTQNPTSMTIAVKRPQQKRLQATSKINSVTRSMSVHGAVQTAFWKSVLRAFKKPLVLNDWRITMVLAEITLSRLVMNITTMK